MSADDAPRPEQQEGERPTTGSGATPVPERGPGDGAAGTGGAAPSPGGREAVSSVATVDTSTPSPAAAVRAAPEQGPPLFGYRWRGPAGHPTLAVLVGAVVAGVAAAVAMPEGSPGAGWPITAVVIAAALVAVAWRTPRSSRAAVVDGAWLVAAVALASVAAVRAAEWLAVLCLLAACGAGGLAVAGRHFRGILTAVVVVPIAALRAVPWIGRRVKQGNLRRAARLLVAAAVSVVLLAIFAPLLAGTDAAFAQVLDGLIPDLDSPSLRPVVLFALGAGCVVGAGFVLLGPPAPFAPPAPARLRGLEWALPAGLLAGLFALYVGVQFASLFGSDDHVKGTAGLTYAEYARGGFWQLLAVTALTLVVISLGLRWAPERTPAERTTKRALLATLAVLTLVIVASALSRMWLYQQAYGFTVLRLLVLTCELWLGVGFVIVLWSVLRLRARGPARGLVVAGAVALLALAVLDPEAFVAARNVDRFERTGQVDVQYLDQLSADAVPALSRLPEPLRSCALEPIARRLRTQATQDDWRSANAARAEAARIFDEQRPVCRG